MSISKAGQNQEVAQSPGTSRRFRQTDEIVIRLAGLLFTGDLLLVGLIISGLIVCPWILPAAIAIGAFLLIASVAIKRFKEPAQVSPPIKAELKELEQVNSSIKAELSETDFFEAQPIPSKELAEIKKGLTQENQKGAIAEWKALGLDLPLLRSVHLDVFLEAYCQVKNKENEDKKVYGFIPQIPGEQAQNIEDYEWEDDQQYLIFGMGIIGSLHSLPPQSLFRQGVNFLRGQSRECHQTLVVIDRSDRENPILWFYDPKGLVPSPAQPDAATTEPLSERLQEIQAQFVEKFGKPLQFRQLRAGLFQAAQPLWNGNLCVYLCAKTAMELGESNRAKRAEILEKNLQETVESVKEYLG